MTIRAAQLCWDHIGSQVQFVWFYPHSNVRSTILGELRQLSWNGNEIYISVTGDDSTGDIEEFTLDPEQEIEFV